MFRSPGDVLFSLNGFDVYTYGVIMAFACLVGVYTSYFIYKKFYPENNYGKIVDCAAWILMFGIIGARLYYCVLNHVYYFSNPLEIINVRQGGLSIHGGLIAGIITLIFLAKKYKLGVLNLLDSFACGTALAQSVGRWGNFFNSEAFGYPTDLPWKLFIPLSKRPDMYSNNAYFHPAFLYESILDLALFIGLFFLMKKYSRIYNGLVTYSYLTLYAIIRFLIEQIRVDSALNISGVPIAEIVSVVMFFVGVVGIICTVKIKK
jgi:phosphatidylglycerol:prolipoprotein diacylglycerol transferase